MTTEITNTPAKTSRLTIQDIKDSIARQRSAWEVVATTRRNLSEANDEITGLKAKRDEIAGDDSIPLAKASKSLTEYDGQILIASGRIERLGTRLQDSIREAADLSRASTSQKIEQGREALYNFRRDKEAHKIAAFLCDVAGSAQTITEYEGFIKSTAFSAAGIASSLTCFDEHTNAYKANMEHHVSEPAFEAAANLILENAAEVEEALEWQEKRNVLTASVFRTLSPAELIKLPKAA